jgi:hypothetical protein
LHKLDELVRIKACQADFERRVRRQPRGPVVIRFVGCLVLGFVSIASSSPSAATRSPAGDRSLLILERPGSPVLAELLREEVLVVRDLGTHVLVVGDARTQAILAEKDLEWEVLDSAVADKTYYLVAPAGPADAPSLARHARVLHQEERVSIVEATPDEALDIVGLGFEIARVFFDPIRLPRETPHRPAAAGAPHPAIEAMVESVSGDRFDAHVNRLQAFQTRYAAHDSCFAAAAWIKAEFESYGIDSVTYHYCGDMYAPNVVAVIPGAVDPERLVVIGAHYDSFSTPTDFAPGADDNATGTACVLECARVLSQFEFERTLVFIAFSAEEMGLIGSHAWAGMASRLGLDIVAMIAVDMIGYVATGDAVDLDVISDSPSMWIRDLAVEAGGLYVPDLPVIDGTFGDGRSDHASFWQVGYPAVWFFEDSESYSPYIHTPSDVIGQSYNSRDLATMSTQVAVATTATLAGPRVSVAILHAPMPDTPYTGEPHRIAADVVIEDVPNLDSLVVHYSTGASFETVQLSPTGAGDEHEAFIPAQPAGTFVNYYLVAEDLAGRRAVHPSGAPEETHRFFVGTITTVVADSFEVESGWRARAMGDDATAGVWLRVDPHGTWSGGVPIAPMDDHTPNPGAICWVTGDGAEGEEPGANDVDGGRTTLMSPLYDLSPYANAVVRYHRWYTNDTGADPSGDQWVVDVSPDDGVTWVRMETLTASRRAWTRVERALTDFVPLTATVRFRVVANDAYNESMVEAGLDDFGIVTYEGFTPVDGEPGVGPAAVEPLALRVGVPNPYDPLATIRVALPSGRRSVTARVFDVAGREVAALAAGPAVAGERALRWDGLDARGRSVASGTFFLRVEAGGEVVVSKLVMAR